MTSVPSAPPPATESDSAGPGRAARALDQLLEGNRRFVAGRPQHGHHVSAAAAAAASGQQQPHAVVFGCIDSRVPLEAIFDQTFGCICVVRSGAHVVDRAVLGSVEFAVANLDVPLIMVLGHERCGAVAATVEAVRTGRRPVGSVSYLVDEITPAVLEVGVDDADAPARATRAHVRRTVQALGQMPAVAASVQAGRVEIVGAVYNLETGQVHLLP